LQQANIIKKRWFLKQNCIGNFFMRQYAHISNAAIEKR
jgi:hypothetical protein